jgi:hypothetical protein
VQEPAAGAGEEQGVAEPGAGDLVAVGAGDALDEPVVAQAPEVVAELPAGHGLGGGAEQGGQVVAKVAAGEAAGQQAEDADGRQQGLGPRVGQGIPATRWPVLVATGPVMAVSAAAPSAGLRLSRWTPSRRRLAAKPMRQTTP